MNIHIKKPKNFNELFIKLWVQHFQDIMTKKFYTSRLNNEYAKPNDLDSATQDCNDDGDRYYFVAKCLKQGEQQGHLEVRAFPEINKFNMKLFKDHVVYLACIFAFSVFYARQTYLNQSVEKYFTFKRNLKQKYPIFKPLIQQIDNSVLKTLKIPNQTEHFLNLLLSKKADLQKEDDEGKTPLFLAAKNCNVNIIQMLLNHKADINYFGNKNGWNVLHYAINESCTTKTIEFLIKNKADVNKSSIIGTTPLFIAVRKNKMKDVELLIKNKADIHHLKNDKSNVINYRADLYRDTSVDSEMIQYLVSLKVDINNSNIDKQTPLMQAAGKGNENLMNTLLSLKANPHLVDTKNKNVVNYVAEGFNLSNQIFKKLLFDLKVDYNLRNRKTNKNPEEALREHLKNRYFNKEFKEQFKLKLEFLLKMKQASK